jgi:hypothetical protein
VAWSHGFHLDIDRHLSQIRPVGVQRVPWQDVQLSVGARVVSNPTHVVLPEQVMDYHARGRVQDGNNVIQREPFVALHV